MAFLSDIAADAPLESMTRRSNALGTMRPEDDIPPLFFDEPYKASSASPTAPSSAQNLSGEIKYPGLKELWPMVFFGPGAVQMKRERLLNERAGPELNKLLQAGEKALQDGDINTANQVAAGLSNLAGSAPRYAKNAESFIGRVVERQKHGATNKAILDIASSFVGTDAKAQRIIGSLENKINVISPEMLSKTVEKLYPEIKENENYVSVMNAVTGKYEQKVKPGTLSLDKMSPQEQKAFTIAGIDKPTQQKYVDSFNRLNLKQGTMEDAAIVGAITPKLQAASQQALQLEQLPPSVGLPMGAQYGSQGNVSGILGYGSQPQMAPNAGASANAQVSPTTQPQGPPDLHLLKPGLAPMTPPAPNLGQLGPKGPPPSRPALPAPEGMRVSPEAMERQMLEDANPKPRRGENQAQALQRADRATQAYEQYKQMTGSPVNAPKRPGPNATVEDFNRYSVELETFRKAQVKRAELDAQRTNEPTGEQSHYFRIDKDGRIVESNERLTQAQAARNYLKTSEPARAQKIRDFAADFNLGMDLFNDLKNIPQERLSNIKRKIDLLVANGVTIPIAIGGAVPLTVNIPGAGVVSLPPEEVELYSRMTAVAQASEDFINPDKKENKYVESVKTALTGALTDKAKALSALKGILESGHRRQMGEFKTNPNSIDKEYKGLNLSIPKESMQGSGGFSGNLEKSGAELTENIDKGLTKLQDIIPLSIKQLGQKAVNNFIESIKKFPEQWEELNRPRPGYNKRYRRNNPSSPINPKTEKKLESMRE